jgi:hypothetical protein
LEDEEDDTAAAARRRDAAGIGVLPLENSYQKPPTANKKMNPITANPPVTAHGNNDRPERFVRRSDGADCAGFLVNIRIGIDIDTVCIGSVCIGIDTVLSDVLGCVNR